MKDALDVWDKKWNVFVLIKGELKVLLFRLHYLPTTYPKETGDKEKWSGMFKTQSQPIWPYFNIIITNSWYAPLG